MNQHKFALWYFTISLIFIILENLNIVYPALAAKALIIPSLMVFYHLVVRGKYNFFHRLIITGLFFSWLGDICLQFADGTIPLRLSADTFFIVGLISFLITQIFYFVGFNIPKGKNQIFSTRLYQTILVILYGVIMLYYLYRKLGDMKIPVIVYTVIILMMLLSALNRYGKVNGLSYILVVIGALLFVISDSLIAVSKFHTKIDFSGILIMVSYVTAQYLIALGCIRQNIKLPGHD